jgi:hypothetical protein
MEATMNTFTIRILTFTAVLGALIVTSSTTDAQPIHNHRPVDHFAQTVLIPWTATALAPKPSAVSQHETDGLSRNPDDCNYGCIDSN